MGDGSWFHAAQTCEASGARLCTLLVRPGPFRRPVERSCVCSSSRSANFIRGEIRSLLQMPPACNYNCHPRAMQSLFAGPDFRLGLGHRVPVERAVSLDVNAMQRTPRRLVRLVLPGSTHTTRVVVTLYARYLITFFFMYYAL